ncbi:MAG: NAD(P)-binding protein, partial [Adlercreutzia sp.]|nr:NAD(P)-binding protein [Adlercreutzia sp.]
MTMENQPSISRRGLLKWAGAGSIALAAAGALSACSPAQSELASTQGDTGAETDSALQERYADLPVEESSAYAVIVGGGAGGLLAAYKLAKEGKTPLLLEKGPSCA